MAFENGNISESWAQRFLAPDVPLSAVATRNASRGIVATNRDGTYRLYGWDVARGTIHPITDGDVPVVSGAISADGEHVYYLKDTQGGAGHVMRAAWDGSGETDLTPDLPAYACFHVTESYSGRYFGFVAANQNGFQVFVVDTAQGGTPHLRYESEAFSVGPLLSYDGEISVIAVQEGGAGFMLEAYDTRSGELLHTLRAPGGMTPVGFANRDGDMRFIALQQHDGIQQPVIWNTRTGETQPVSVNLPGDIAVWDWSRDGRKLLLCHHWQARQTLHTLDLRSGELTAIYTGGGSFGHVAGYWLDDGRIVAHWQDATTPVHVAEIDRSDASTRPKPLLTVGDAPLAHPWREVHLSAALQGWLTTPAHDGPYPTILHVHGGPGATTYEAYHPMSQAWVDAGYAFLSINYRGSATFGADFTQAIRGQVTQPEADDLAAGARWLIEQNIARAETIFLTGSAYGGTVALMAAVRYPALWRGVAVTQPITDWARLYDAADDMRGLIEWMMGGAPAAVPDTYTAASPLAGATRLNIPVCVVVDENDTRIPAEQVQDYITALKAADGEVRVAALEQDAADRRFRQIEQQRIWMRFAAACRGL